MKQVLALQLSALVLIAGAFGGLIVYSPIYDNVQSRIVSILCLSCIKLDPKSQVGFTFETANGKPHPAFVLDNLTKGPVFIAYREDVCTACDIMEPVIQEIFGVTFEKEDTVVETVRFDDSNVIFIHINLDHAPKEMGDSLFIYDKDHVGGVPMFTVVTIGYHHGFIEPIYTTVYGTLNLGTNEGRKAFLTTLIADGITQYNQFYEGYKTP
jgi:thiol-disulfide isomerase/thioredoxin